MKIKVHMRLSDFPKVTQLTSCGASIQTISLH
jgi:hypothetical protein